jgi:hypothetical protein
MVRRQEEIEQAWFGRAVQSSHRYDEKSFKEGIEWADAHHWHSCDGDYLPDFDEVVLVTLIWEDSEEGENESDVTFSHRSDNPRVIVDENGFAKIIDGVKYGSWCRIPKFTKK